MSKVELFKQALKAENNLITLDEALELIHDIAIDYDGYRSSEDLMRLIDEMKEIAITARLKVRGKLKDGN